eukprot:1158801-Pelagomonas_calceolata.AAC.7
MPTRMPTVLALMRQSSHSTSKAPLILKVHASIQHACLNTPQDLGLSINAAKHELDTLKTQAEAMKAARQGKDADAAQVRGVHAL